MDRPRPDRDGSWPAESGVMAKGGTVRIRESGHWGRAIVGPVCAVMVLIPAIWIGTTARSPDLETFFIPLAFFVVGLSGLARSLRIGITFRQEVIVVRSWFITRQIATAEIQSLSFVPYSGYINRFNESPWFRMLNVRTVDGRSRDFRATMASRASSRRQLDQLRELTGHPSVPRPDGPTHRSS